MKNKDIYNLKQAMTGIQNLVYEIKISCQPICFYAPGLGSDEWADTCKLLANLNNNAENVINVTSNDKSEIVCVYIQLAEQRRFYKKYGEVIQMDAMHNITSTPMPLYTLIAVDNYGIEQPVAFFFVRHENAETISMGLKHFSEVSENCL